MAVITLSTSQFDTELKSYNMVDW